MALGFPIAQRLTLWSSPPVTKTLDDFRPIFKQLTVEECATNSSIKPNVKDKNLKIPQTTKYSKYKEKPKNPKDAQFVICT